MIFNTDLYPYISYTGNIFFPLFDMPSESRSTTLCYVMLCYVMLCYVMLCYVMLCYCYCSLSLYI